MEASPTIWARSLRMAIAVLLFVLVCEVIWLLIQAYVAEEPERDLVWDSGNKSLLESRLQTLPEYREAIDRTLFTWNRKPKPGAKADAQKSEDSDKWVLTGLVNTGVSTYAIFSEQEGGERVRLEEGQSLDSWSVESVTANEVVLVNGEESKVLKLEDARSTDEEESESAK